MGEENIPRKWISEFNVGVGAFVPGLDGNYPYLFTRSVKFDERKSDL